MNGAQKKELTEAEISASVLSTIGTSKLSDMAIGKMTSSYEGKGYHSLLAETGSKLYKNLGESIVWKAFVKKRNFYLFSPNVNEFDKNHFFPELVELFNEWDTLIEKLEKVYGNKPKAAVFPTSIQLAG